MHFVYELHKDGELVYVGRSKSPHVRKVVQERKHKCVLEQKIIYRSEVFERAAERERKEIRTRRPKWNKIVNSSSGMLNYRHSEAACAQMSTSKKMKPMSAEGRESLRLHNKGRPVPAEVRRRISETLTGRTLTLAHRNKIGMAVHRASVARHQLASEKRRTQRGT